jgi:hypothetical protein
MEYSMKSFRSILYVYPLVGLLVGCAGFTSTPIEQTETKAAPDGLIYYMPRKSIEVDIAFDAEKDGVMTVTVPTATAVPDRRRPFVLAAPDYFVGSNHAILKVGQNGLLQSASTDMKSVKELAKAIGATAGAATGLAARGSALFAAHVEGPLPEPCRKGHTYTVVFSPEKDDQQSEKVCLMTIVPAAAGSPPPTDTAHRKLAKGKLAEAQKKKKSSTKTAAQTAILTVSIERLIGEADDRLSDSKRIANFDEQSGIFYKLEVPYLVTAFAVRHKERGLNSGKFKDALNNAPKTEMNGGQDPAVVNLDGEIAQKTSADGGTPPPPGGAPLPKAPLPQRSTAGETIVGDGRAFIAYSPNASPILFAPLKRSLFADNNTTISLADGAISIDSNVGGELVGLLSLPADVLTSYTEALGGVFTKFGTVSDNQIKSDASAAQLRFCEMTIAANPLHGVTPAQAAANYNAIKAACAK